MITQLSAFNLCLSTVEGALDAISRAGFYNLSLYFSPSQFTKRIHELDEFEIEEILHRAELFQLKVVSLGGPSNLLDDEGVECLKRALRVAGDMDADVFDTGSLSFKGKAAEQIAAETRLFCDNIRRAADVAGEADVVLCLETHGGMTGTPARCLEAMAAINHPNVGIGFDPANIIFYEGGDPFAELDELLPFIGHVHAKDKVGGQDVADFPTVGSGEIDFEGLLAQLTDGGYGGYVSAERVSGETDEERAEELVKAHDFLARAMG